MEKAKVTMRKLRRDADITQEKLAEKIGISSTAYAKIEWGIQYPKVETIIKLSKALNVEPGEVLDAVIETRNKKEVEDFESDVRG